MRISGWSSDVCSSDLMDFDRYDQVRPIRWDGQQLHLLDQRALPFVETEVVCANAEAVASAIHALVVRGAPAIGIAAAWAVVMAGRGVQAADGSAAWAHIDPNLPHLEPARPPAGHQRR